MLETQAIFVGRLIKKKEQFFEGPSAFVPRKNVEPLLIDLDRFILHDVTHGRPSSRPGGVKPYYKTRGLTLFGKFCHVGKELARKSQGFTIWVVE